MLELNLYKAIGLTGAWLKRSYAIEKDTAWKNIQNVRLKDYCGENLNVDLKNNCFENSLRFT